MDVFFIGIFVFTFIILGILFLLLWAGTGTVDNTYQSLPAETQSDSSDNQGEIGIDLQGDVTLGIGNNLTIDLSDGSVGMNVGGINIDLDGK